MTNELETVANSRGGVCVLGVDDSRDVLGIELWRLDIAANFVRALCLDCVTTPPLMPMIERLTLPDRTGALLPVLRVEIPRCLFVHRSQNGYTHRVGGAKREMPPDYLARLLQQPSQVYLIRFLNNPFPVRDR